MLRGTNTTLTLSGLSGKQYLFNLYTFDTFQELKDSFKPLPALYVFSKRWLKSEDAYSHDLIYLGETGDLSSRFNSHHKEEHITKLGANCIGLFLTTENDVSRKLQEKDILGAYDFPCNEIKTQTE